MRPSCLLPPLVLAVVACGGGDPADRSTEVYAELRARVDASATIFHFGCTDPTGCAACPVFEVRCGDGRWWCGQAALDELRRVWTTAPPEVTVSWLSPPTFVGPFFHFYLARPDATATHYWETKSDVSGDTCGDYCGWHRQEETDFMAADGTPQITLGQTVSDFSACCWPASCP